MKENIDLSLPEMKTIMEDSNNNINHAIWLLEFKKFNISNDKKWTYIIDNIVNLVVDKSNYNTLKMYSLIKKVRELFYILFITNIEFTIIIRKIMIKLLEKDFDLEIKSNIVEITSIFELRISQGTRYIIHLEAYIIRIIYLLYKHSEKKNHNAQLTEMKVLEI